MYRTRIFFAFCLLSVCAGAMVIAVDEPSGRGRFDGLVIYDPSASLGRIAQMPADLPGFEQGAAGWEEFRRANGGGWRVWLDRHTAAPFLVEGRGIEWMPAQGPKPATVLDLEETAREFVRHNSLLFRIDPSELVLNREGSVERDRDHWFLLFDRVVDGIPVENQQLRMHVNFGNLVAFGTDRWGAVETIPETVYTAETAREALYAYMGIDPDEAVFEPHDPYLVLIPVPAESGGLGFRLVWRFTVQVEHQRGSWAGKVDAETGEILAFYDDARYVQQVKGGVYPVTDDQACPWGCEQPNYPMPFADIDIDGIGHTANDMGLFECSPVGGTATTTLIGPYVRISDNCGSISESAVCEDDIDLQVSGGTDCTVPAGTSPGNSHSSRTSFYHLNRIKQKGRYWMPSNGWLAGQLRSNLNINNTCNAYWNGTVNFYRSGGGCRNTGEIAGVVMHEFGHGMDSNDGGGYDNPSEAYADVTTIIQERQSCVGPGFRVGVNCSGFGDPCIDCTGVREMDWDMREAHTPATPSGFIDPNCGGGDGTCGRQVHCESTVPSETMYDLATRDLPAMGMDQASAWELVEKLFWGTRSGSGGPVYNCSLPNSDSCGAGTWFTNMRILDDDDGNLDNGTPHAAAIFAAFDRHDIACGSAADPTHQNSSGCPTLAAPVLTGSAGSNSAGLSWDAVADAGEYIVLRNEFHCDDYSFLRVTHVPAPTTNYTDTDLPNDFTFHYRVQAVGANPACESPVSNCVTVVPQPFAGTIKLGKPVYSCSSVIELTVRDANTGSTTVDVTIFSDTETEPETVTLSETEPGSARFHGTITATSGSSVHGDGLLGMSHGDTITARYIDADDGEGGTNLTRETTASGDCIGPVISGVTEEGVSDVQATVRWSTDEASSSVVHWGESTPPGSTADTPGMVTEHAVTLGGLQQCTVYYYEVVSEDAPGNIALDDDNGSFYHFETLGDFGDGLQPCHQGKITLEDEVVSCSSSLPVRLIDIDLNLDSFAVDTVTVTVTSSTETTPETILLTETGPNTSTFTGSIATAAGPAVAGDGILQTAGGDILTATYRDADDGTGDPGSDFDTSVADCSAPEHPSIEVTSITDESAVVTWSTSEPSTGYVEWGLAPDLGNQTATTPLQTGHSRTIGTFPECGRVYFRIVSTDAYGNTVVADAGGVPFEFNANTIPGAVFRDGFETDTGWSLEGEWEIGEPLGMGSSPADPTQAYSGEGVLGHDLTGQGSYEGDYEIGGLEHATSPTIDASALAFGELKFRRWLNVGGGAVAYVEVKQGNEWIALWNSNSISGLSESSWSLQSFDISPYADGNDRLQIRFKLRGGIREDSHRSGWNVDRFIVRDGSLPDFDICGGCGGAPSFGGVSGAADVDPCGDSGITLNWEAAPAWGTGHAGTYAIYRDTDPGFVPSAGNLVAGGITGTSWTDTGAPDDVTLYYVVRAENDETCSTGPNNGGVMDGNLVRMAVRDETYQILPGSVGNTVLVDAVNDAHARLEWSPVTDAADYHVYRGTSPQGPFDRIGETVGTSYEDANQWEDPGSYYYLVRAADACGNEGP